MDFSIRWIGQSGFIVAMGEKKLCIDPYLSNACAKEGKFERLVRAPIEPAVLTVDMILSTHNHIDHLDEQTIRKTDMSRILYAGPGTCIAHFLKIGIGAERLVTLNRGQSAALGYASLTAVPANHTRDSIGIVVRYGGMTVYFTGDSTFSDELVQAKQYAPDILIACINGRMGNMACGDAARLAKALGVKVAVPCHYGMFAENTENPENFRKALAGSGTAYFEFEFDREYTADKMLHDL